MLEAGNRAGCPGTRSAGSEAANTDRRAHRRQEATLRSGSRARLYNGLASHRYAGVTGSPRPSSQPGRPGAAGSARRPGTGTRRPETETPRGGLRPPAPAQPGRPPGTRAREGSRATERQRRAPAGSPQPRTKFSGQRDRRPRRGGCIHQRASQSAVSSNQAADHPLMRGHERR
jgi:hypothetical protein